VLHLNILTFAKVTLSHGIEKEFEGQEIEGYFNKPIVFEGLPFSRLLGINCNYSA
jgi:hypothetical protein